MSVGTGNVVSVGGTSGTGANNHLNLNLGGVDVSYELGPSVSTVTQQAYSFLNSSFNNDMAFEGGAIYGANNLVAGLTAPLIAGATAQLKENATVVPQLFGETIQNDYNLSQSALADQTAIANASIQSSTASANAASNAGGGCYVTSAVCDTLGLPDDCYTLKVLRNFRDTYLMRSNVGRAFVEEYYATAPALCERMRNRADAREYVARLYERFILPALLAIEGADLARAFKIYRTMIYAVRSECT
jgi:hypothetical protein